jgi:hypothetical protein
MREEELNSILWLPTNLCEEKEWELKLIGKCGELSKV